MIFGIDFGLKRIGIARVVQNIIVPLPPIIRKNRHQASKELYNTLMQYCKDMHYITLVVGMPLQDKSCNDIAQDSKAISPIDIVMQKRITHFLSLIGFCGKIIYIDESYSSVEANHWLKDRHYKNRKNARKDGKLDSISACIILERYMAQQQALQAKENLLMQDTYSTNKAIQDKAWQANSCYVQDICIESIAIKDSMQHIMLDTQEQEILAIQDSETITKIPHTNHKNNKIAATPHIPVLLEHVLDTFDRIFLPTHINYIPHSYDKDTTKVLIDCTLGFGGMSRALLSKYHNLHIIGIDRDMEALQYNKKNMQEFGSRLQIRHGDFSTLLPSIIKEIQQSNAQLCGILADIGVSSYQFDTLERGFSFHAKELDMRMDTTQTLRADTILNTYSKYMLEQIFKDYGEIREYKKLVNLIIQERKLGAITGENLQNIALQMHTKTKIHPATLIYQALRIAVNDELGQLRGLLEACRDLHHVLLCIISFHSLEDRIIKETFRQWTRSCLCDVGSFQCTCGNNHAKGLNLYKKPLSADNKELARNKRARSAKLRAFYFV